MAAPISSTIISDVAVSCIFQLKPCVTTTIFSQIKTQAKGYKFATCIDIVPSVTTPCWLFSSGDTGLADESSVIYDCTILHTRKGTHNVHKCQLQIYLIEWFSIKDWKEKDLETNRTYLSKTSSLKLNILTISTGWGTLPLYVEQT